MWPLLFLCFHVYYFKRFPCCILHIIIKGVSPTRTHTLLRQFCILHVLKREEINWLNTVKPWWKLLICVIVCVQIPRDVFFGVMVILWRSDNRFLDVLFFHEREDWLMATICIAIWLPNIVQCTPKLFNSFSSHYNSQVANGNAL